MMRTKVGIRIRTAVLLWTTVLINFLTVSAERTLSLSDFFSGLSPPLRGGLKGIVQSRSNHVEDASARIVVTYKDCDGDQECINVKDFRKVTNLIQGKVIAHDINYLDNQIVFRCSEIQTKETLTDIQRYLFGEKKAESVEFGAEIADHRLDDISSQGHTKDVDLDSAPLLQDIYPDDDSAPLLKKAMEKMGPTSLEHAMERMGPNLKKALENMDPMIKDAFSMLKKRDLKAVMEKFDLKAVMENLDLKAVMEKFDLKAVMEKFDLKAVMEKFDLKAMLEKRDSSFSKALTSFQHRNRSTAHLQNRSTTNGSVSLLTISKPKGESENDDKLIDMLPANDTTVSEKDSIFSQIDLKPWLPLIVKIVQSIVILGVVGYFALVVVYLIRVVFIPISPLLCGLWKWLGENWQGLLELVWHWISAKEDYLKEELEVKEGEGHNLAGVFAEGVKIFKEWGKVVKQEQPDKEVLENFIIPLGEVMINPSSLKNATNTIMSTIDNLIMLLTALMVLSLIGFSLVVKWILQAIFGIKASFILISVVTIAVFAVLPMGISILGDLWEQYVLGSGCVINPIPNTSDSSDASDSNQYQRKAKGSKMNAVMETIQVIQEKVIRLIQKNHDGEHVILDAKNGSEHVIPDDFKQRTGAVQEAVHSGGLSEEEFSEIFDNIAGAASATINSNSKYNLGNSLLTTLKNLLLEKEDFEKQDTDVLYI